MVQLLDTFAPTRQALSQLGQNIGQQKIRGLQELAAKQGLERGAMQNQLLRGQISQIQKDSQEKRELENFISQSEYDRARATAEFYKQNNPEKYMEYSSNIFKQAKPIFDIDPEGAAKFVNENLGTELKYRGKDGKLERVEDLKAGKVHFFSQDGSLVKTVEVTPEEKDDKAQSDIGKIRADQKAGLITKAEADNQIKLLKNGGMTNGDKNFAPTQVKKLIDERQELIDSGVPEDHKFIKAYDDKIAGQDTKPIELSQEEIDTLAAMYNVSGKMITLGRGKDITKLRKKIAKSAASQLLEGTTIDPGGKTPIDAALSAVVAQSDTKAIQGSLNFLDKQLSSMGSFVTNLNSQIDKVGELSKDLNTFDTRLMNVPLRALRGRLIGSPLQSKYDLYLTEIESEIGKLATGSTGSVAELSATAQEKWDKIHDKSLSVSDMLELLDETKAAANFRVESVRDQLNKTRERMRTRKEPGAETDEDIIKEIGDIKLGRTGTVTDTLPPDAKQIGTSNGKPVYELPDGRKFIED